MLEAVNSVISNAPLVRPHAEQASSSRSLTANPESVQVVAQAPYISPYIRVDVNYDTAVLAIRDRDTGDFLTTIPSDARLQAKAREAAQYEQPQVRQQVTQSSPESSGGATQAPAAPQESTPPQQSAGGTSFDAFTKQVSSLMTAIDGGSTGGTVSLSA